MKGKEFWAYYFDLTSEANKKNIDTFFFEFRNKHYLVEKKGDQYLKPKKITKL